MSEAETRKKGGEMVLAGMGGILPNSQKAEFTRVCRFTTPHFESRFDTVSASAIVLQQPVKAIQQMLDGFYVVVVDSPI